MTGTAPKTFYTGDRKEWRRWLQTHFDKEKEIWFVFPKDSAGKPRLGYNDATEEALCFGWIDSTKKPLDEHHTIMRFTPRKPKASYSQLNKERLVLLMREKQIHPSMEPAVQKILNEPFVFPDDIKKALQKDNTVWENFRRFPEAYQRLRIASVDVLRKQPDAFQKRLDNLVEKTRQNKMIQIAGVEKYY